MLWTEDEKEGYRLCQENTSNKQSFAKLRIKEFQCKTTRYTSLPRAS